MFLGVVPRTFPYLSMWPYFGHFTPNVMIMLVLLLCRAMGRCYILGWLRDELGSKVKYNTAAIKVHKSAQLWTLINLPKNCLDSVFTTGSEEFTQPFIITADHEH